MLQRSLAVLGVLALGCLPAFGPDLRARNHHAGLEPSTSGDQCMGCHVDEREAIAAGVDADHPAPAPIVADWMLEDSRECTVCHHLFVPRERAIASRLAPLAPGATGAR